MTENNTSESSTDNDSPFDNPDRDNNSMDESELKDGMVTQTSGFDTVAETDPEKGDFEIGFEDGEGYIKLPVHITGEVEKFTIPANEVKQYRQRRNEINPTPSLPDGIEREADFTAPGDFQGGKALNTGGGIFCRIWKKELRDGYKLEVIYELPQKDGIEIYLTDEEGAYLGEIHLKVFDGFRHDSILQPKARELMVKVEKGVFEEEIEEKIKSAND